MVDTMKLLNILQQHYSVFFVNSTVEGDKSPPIVTAAIRLPEHETVHKVKHYRVVNLNIRIDKMLRRALRELRRPFKRYQAKQISDVTLLLLLAGLYAPNYAVWRFRSKIRRALKQLPKESKVRRYITWRLTVEAKKQRGDRVW